MRPEELDEIPSDWKPKRFEDYRPIKGEPASSKRWMVTVNLNSMPKSLQSDVLSDDAKRWERCEAWLNVMLPGRRWIGQLEEGEEDHKRHIQLAVCDSSVVPQRYLREHLGWAHVERMHQPPVVGVRYCTKDETRVAGFWKNGDWDHVLEQRPGKRTDLTVLRDRILDLDDDYISEHTILDDGDLLPTVLRYPQVVDRLFAERRWRLQQRRPATKRECIWLWGTTGTGKSDEVDRLRDLGVLGTVYEATAGNHPFDGYVDQETVYMEEFRGAGVLPSEMLVLTDKYSDVTMSARRYNKSMLHERVIVTSNMTPASVYPNIDDRTREAWLRRWKVFEKRSMNDHPLFKFFGVEPPRDLSVDEIRKLQDEMGLKRSFADDDDDFI